MLIANLSDRDRRYVRAWILRWVGEDGDLLIPPKRSSNAPGISPPPIKF
jgi:hypothetical protein